MGLDQYFYRKEKGEKDGSNEEVAYFRKVNCLRKWLVKNAGYDNDGNCIYHEVTKEQLEKLVADCKQVIAAWDSETDTERLLDGKSLDVAHETMPTQSGLFFGSTEYDSWYIDSLKSIVSQVQGILETTNFEEEVISYWEWW